MEYFILYKTTNIINGKFYIGIHRTMDLDDGYIGSGRNLKIAIKKYGKENFKREILKYCNSYEELSIEERKIVNEDFCKRKDTYNQEIGGKGGKIWTDELKKKMSDVKKQKYNDGLEPWNKGKKVGNFMTEKTRAEMSKKFSGNGNPMYGINVANVITAEKNTERLRKISENNRKPKLNKKKYSEYAKNRFWIVNENNKLEHCCDENDERLISGNYKKGRVWKSS